MPAGLLKEPPPDWAAHVFEDVGDWSAARNILFVRLDTLGDVLMTTPAMRAFKQGQGSSITLLTSPAGAKVAGFVPEIDEVLVYEAPWMKASARRPTSAADRELIAELEKRSFDGAVIPTVYSQNPLPSAFLCYLAEIPLRAAHCHENPYQLLTHWVKDPEPELLVRHEVRRQLDLAAALGARAEDTRLSFQIPETAKRNASALLDSVLGQDELWILAHPGATAPSRRYPPAPFAQALRLLHDATGARLLLTGTEDDRPLVDAVATRLAGLPCASLAGRTSLAELAAVIQAAPLLVSNNTGPVHLAAALGTPVVDLYALTNPQHTPWEVPHRVLYHDVPCRICYKSVCPEGHQRCLAEVKPEAVAAAARELLGER